jgi:CRISPR-associated protein Csm1
MATGRHVPTTRDGSILQFSEITSMAEGRPILAVLKADVDDLGEILATHFTRADREIVSPSRVNTFSRFLSVFFEGRVNELATERFPAIYMVFAGGDDLLAVGPWDQVIEFALSVVDEFRKWTAGNPAFHLSAGIALGDQTRPILAGLREAETLLDAAKQAPGKASVAMMGHVLRWGDLADCWEWHQRLVVLVGGTGGDDPVGRALLQRLKKLEKLATGKDGRVRYGPELWRLYYSLRRLSQRHRARKSELGEIEKQALQAGGALKVAMAARLAEFATRRRSTGERSESYD